MAANRWHRVSALFLEALQRPRPISERPTRGAEERDGDEGLQREVEGLLGARESAGGIRRLVPDEPAVSGLEGARRSALPGERIGPYRIISEIGRGGMGEVYQAEDPRLGRLVALKFLPPELIAHEAAGQRLLSEARAASALDHPNICTVYDVGRTEDGRLFFAMAFYDGETLAERIARGPLPVADALAIVLQVGRGLEHAHEKGVIHRDVKPSNVFLTERREVKILDFGLAKRGVSALTQPGTVLGTVAYMSPEQAVASELDHRTDIWSLGVVLHEAVTGKLPFEGESDASLLYAVVNAEPELVEPRGAPLPGAWQRILRRALDKVREHRYQRMEDLLQDLSSLQEEIELRSGESQRPGRPAVAAGLAGRGDTSQAASADSEPTLRPEPVGREREMEALWQAWAGCLDGRGLVACVTGEPGIGKTTLIDGFLADLAAAGEPLCYMARGRCSERLAGSEAYLPVLEALESLLQGDARDLAIRLMKEKAPTWYVRIAPVPAASDPSFAEVMADAKLASQERMKRELHTFLRELSGWRPLVLFCDDVHWADVSTVDLLSYVGARCDSMRLLVLASYRPSDLLLGKHPFLDVQRELQGRGLCREVAVGLLTEQDIASYVDQMFPESDFPAFFASLLHARTEGNPLFMTELLRDLRERSVIALQEARWVLAQSVPELQRDLPESVRGMIERKIERLRDDDRRMLAGAAVQGQEFDSATIAGALGLDVGEVEERLEPLDRSHRFVNLLEDAELPDRTLTQRYSFAHVLYQNALYATLRRRQRAALSAAVAAALLRSYGEDRREIASQLGYLFESARDFERAADFWLLAAEKAASVDANQEAVMLARRAIAAAERLQGDVRLSRLLAAANRLGELHLTLSDLEAAIVDFEMAESAAAELGEVEAQVNAVCAAAQATFNLNRMEETRERANRALDLARAARSEVAMAAAELLVGLERLCCGETEVAKESFSRSVPILRETGPPLHALEAIGFAGLSHAWQLDYGEADEAIGWALEHARERGVAYHTIMNLFVRGMSFFNQGRLSEGLGDLQEGMRLAEENNERYWLSRYPNTLGWAFRELQDADRALELNVEGAEVANENGYGKPEANAHVNLAQFHIGVGELSRALEHLGRAEEIFEAGVWFRWRYNIRLKAEWSRYWMRLGDGQRAGEYAAESLALAEPRKARKHMAWAHKLLGDVAVLEERFADGRREYEAALQVLRRHRCPIIEWKIYLSAAEMASAYREVPLAEHYRGRCRTVIRSLADSIGDDVLRRRFLASEEIRAALA